LTVEYRPNESTEETIQRTKREYDEWCQNFKEIPRGAMPGVKKEYIVVRRVVWFYWSRILGESDYAIAKAFKVDHKAIPKGIRRTEDLLNLISSEFE
jgi:hypothetical protein